MKKYIKPSLTIFHVNAQTALLAGSLDIYTDAAHTVNSSNLAAGEYEELIDDEY